MQLLSVQTAMPQYLPHDVLTVLLERVLLQQRLGSCALVQRSWQAAAAAATHSIWLSREFSDSQLDGLLAWLAKHGHPHVESLDLHDYYQTSDVRIALQDLPSCPQLHVLRLQGMQLQLAPGNGHSGMLSGCTGLKELELSDCHMLEGPNSLTALSALSNLQELNIAYLAGNFTSDCSGSDFGEEDPVFLPGALLSQLTQLTSLRTSDISMNEFSLQHLSCLTELQVLQLRGPCECTISVSTTPGLSQLTALTELNLFSFELEPTALAGLTQLQSLELAYNTVPGGSSGFEALLAWIAKLQDLCLLSLAHRLNLDGAPGPPSPAYAALTSSSKLENLTIEVDGMPGAAWQHVFPAGRQLPNLSELKLEFHNKQNSGILVGHGNVPDDIGPVTASNLDALVQCCPSLQRLWLQYAVQPGMQLSALQRLSVLHSLTLHPLPCSAADTITATAQDLAQLSQLTVLTDLIVTWPRIKARQELLPFTSLTQLKSLRLQDSCWGWRPSEVSIWNKAPRSSPPDVWSQLLEYCNTEEPPLSL